MWKVEKSGGAFRAVSHYLNWYSQMSCVTSWWKAYHNTSGHYNIFASAASLQEPTVGLILPVENVARLSSFELCSLPWARPGCLCQMCCIYLGHPLLHPPCCRAQCQSQCRGRCYGRGSEGLRREVRGAGLDYRLTKVSYLLTGQLGGYCEALFHYSTRTLEGWINVMVQCLHIHS